MKTLWISLAVGALVGLAVDRYHRGRPWLKDPIVEPFDPTTAEEFLGEPLAPMSMQVVMMSGVPVVYRMDRSGRIVMWIMGGNPQVLREP